MDLSLNLAGTHVLITGGSGMIGSVAVSALLSADCRVTSLDLAPSPILTPNPNLLTLRCDISDEAGMEAAFATATEKFGPVACCVALAGLDLSVLQRHESLTEMSVEQWRRTARVNQEGTFLTARTWLRGLKAIAAAGSDAGKGLKNVGLIIVGSESGTFGERGNGDYAAGKSAVQVGLMKSLLGDVTRVWPGARVNVVAPGPVDTAQFRRECKTDPNQYYMDAQATVGMKTPVPPEQVAKSILFLASESWSGNVMGQVLAVDSGKQGKLLWTKEEC